MHLVHCSSCNRKGTRGKPSSSSSQWCVFSSTYDVSCQSFRGFFILNLSRISTHEFISLHCRSRAQWHVSNRQKLKKILISSSRNRGRSASWSFTNTLKFYRNHFKLLSVIKLIWISCWRLESTWIFLFKRVESKRNLSVKVSSEQNRFGGKKRLV